jgi:hypothetical protein
MKQNNVINKVSFFASKTADNLNDHFNRHYYKLSNRCVKILIPYTYSIQEFYDEYEDIRRCNALPEDVLAATEDHRHSIEFLAKGLVRVRIYTSWWFDLYTTIDEETLERELVPAAKKEQKHNERIILNEMEYLDELQKKIEHFEDLANGWGAES